MVAENVVVFLTSLLVGALGIHVGALLITGTRDYTHAVFTAGIGAIVWAIAGFLFGWIPLLGPVLVFLAYLWVVKRRYPGGWITAGGIALVAWIASIAVLSVLSTLGLTNVGATGIPGI